MDSYSTPYLMAAGVAAQPADAHTDKSNAPASQPAAYAYLATPPENIADSFANQEGAFHDARGTAAWGQKPDQLAPINRTPPATPIDRDLPSIGPATAYAVKDPQLFPEHAQSERAQSPQPLFPRQSPAPTQPIEPAPARYTPNTGSRNWTAPPVVFPNNRNIKSAEQALEYFRKNLAEAKQMKGRRLPVPNRSSSASLTVEDARQLALLMRLQGVTKSRSTPRVASKPKAAAAASPIMPSPAKVSPAKTSPPKQRVSKPRTKKESTSSVSPVKEPATKYKRAPPSKHVDHADVKWSELPDYAPPTSDLDSNPRRLKVTWNGTPLQMTIDGNPAMSSLHEQEVQIASMLRLSCDSYLTNKRKIFQARFQSLKDGKNFTKTAAQSACAIDVNKASQLWAAYNGVGWFDEEWFAQHL